MDIHKLIAGISPETYCQPESAKQVRRQLRKKDTAASPSEAVLQAAMSAEPKPANLLPLERLEEMDLFDCPGLKSPRAQFTYARDAFAESIEGFYFSILNHLEALEGWHVFKLVDEFQASLLAPAFADAAKQQSLIQRQVFEGLDAVHALTRDMLDTVQQLEAQQPAAGQGDQNTSTTRESRVQSDSELRRAQLRSQLALLKLRAAAIRPWLQRGELTSPHQRHSPALVNAFNTAVFQVILLAVGPDVVPEAVGAAELPRWMLNKVRRAYRPVLVLELQFRARPHHSRSQGYAYRGRAEVTLTSYGLHDGELSVLRQAAETSALRDSIQMNVGEATDALNDVVHRVEQLVQPQPAVPVDRCSEDTNPFSVMFSLFAQVGRWLLGKPKHATTCDLHWEKLARCIAIKDAHRVCEQTFDVLKAQTSHAAA